MFDVVIPKVGMSVTEVEITKWKVKEGDKVNKGDEIVEIAMEKANTVLTSEVSGIVDEILFKEGDTVKVGEAICRIKEL